MRGLRDLDRAVELAAARGDRGLLVSLADGLLEIGSPGRAERALVLSGVRGRERARRRRQIAAAILAAKGGTIVPLEGFERTEGGALRVTSECALAALEDPGMDIRLGVRLRCGELPRTVTLRVGGEPGATAGCTAFEEVRLEVGVRHGQWSGSTMAPVEIRVDPAAPAEIGVEVLALDVVPVPSGIR